MIVSPGVKKSLIAARDAGILIVICTGRPTYRAMQIADQLHADPDYLVTCNGAVVVDYQARRILSRKLMPAFEAHALVREIIDAGIVPAVFEEPETPGDRGQRVLYPAGMERGDWAIGDPFVMPSDKAVYRPTAPKSQAKRYALALRGSRWHTARVSV